jgi:hypothetical protein
MIGLAKTASHNGAEEFERGSEAESVAAQEAHARTPASGMKEKQVFEACSPESLVIDSADPEDFAKFKREIPGLSLIPHSEDLDSELAAFEREILLVLYEESLKASRRRDAELTPEEAKTNPLHEGDKHQADEITLPTEGNKGSRYTDEEGEDESEDENFRGENVITTDDGVEETDVLQRGATNTEAGEPTRETVEQKPLKIDIGDDEVDGPLNTRDFSPDYIGRQDEANLESQPSVQKIVALFEHGSPKSVETQTSFNALRSPSKSGKEELPGLSSHSSSSCSSS